jgi:YD repeat-containing protein
MMKALRVSTIALVAVLTFVCNTASSQGQKIQSTYYENVNPAKPLPASFGSFGNTKINYFTGMPEIVLDLFTLDGREQRLPISLSYDATGVKTDELSGPVGMKWVLNAGGHITRDLNGLPDEHPDKGYWKMARQTNYYTNLNPEEWTRKCENNEWDCAPDTYVVNINGRTIRFVFDQYKNAHTIPRQNIRIAYTLSTSFDANQVQLNEFQITLEDGIRYIFGGATESIEERKIEKLIIKTSFRYKEPWDCPYTPWPTNEPAATYSYWCTGGFESNFDTNTDQSVKTVPFYTHKWLLKSIVLPSGELTTFSYAKLPNVVYTLKPSSIKIQNIMATVPFAENESEYCSGQMIFGECLGSWVTEVTHLYYPAAVRKFPKTDPGSDPFGIFEPTDPIAFDPFRFRGNPGSVNFYHVLITESNTKLISISAANGNRVSFSTSLREDLPGAPKYDIISLYNMNGKLVQSRRFNYITAGSDELQDYMWFSEAMLLHHLDKTKQPGPYYANYFQRHLSTDFKDALYAKFVFEGVKGYNYKRLFLSSIDDVTDANIASTLYEFKYSEMEHLKRRTTTYHDKLGYHRLKKTKPESTSISESRVAILSNSHSPMAYLGDGSAPLAGRLHTIVYPTSGYTRFSFTGTGARLQLIQDFDHSNQILRQKELTYSQSFGTTQVFQSFQDFYSQAAEGWMKYMVQSSSPQNDSYEPAYFIDMGSPSTIVYDGTKENNNGWEQFTFTSFADSSFRDRATAILSIPAESREDGSPLTEIFPFPKRHDRSHLRGHLMSHKVFSKNSTIPVAETHFEYEVNSGGYKPLMVRGFKGGTFAWTTKETTDFWYGKEVKAVLRHRYAIYNITADWLTLKRKREFIYDDLNAGNKTERITEFTYDPVFLQQTESRTFLTSDLSNKVRTHTKYVTDNDYNNYRDCLTEFNQCKLRCTYSSPTEECFADCDKASKACESYSGHPEKAAIEILKSSNAISTPVEIQTWSEDKSEKILLSAVVYKYRRIAGAAKPAEVWATSQSIKFSEYVSSSFISSGAFSFDHRLRKVHTFDAYDPVTLRLTGQTGIDGVAEAYAWGPGGSYLKATDRADGPLVQKNLFSYEPLVGLISTTDPNGIVSSYEYDKNGRLTHAYRQGDLQTRYFYHKLADTYKETLTAAIKIVGPRLAGQKLRFETPLEARSSGNITYSWSIVRGATLPSKNFAEYTFATPGRYKVGLKKSHPEFGSASASVEFELFAVRRIIICVDGPYRVDAPSNGIPPLFGSCTTDRLSQTTTLKATYEGFCGTEQSLTYRWDVQDQAGNWIPYSNTGPSAPPPPGFLNRTLGEHKVRCTVTDSCGFTATSEVTLLSII